MKLVTPSAEYQDSYINMVREVSEQGEAFVPFVLKEQYDDFSAMVKRLESYSNGNSVPENFVPHSTFWLVDEDGCVVGCSNLRHQLNDGLLVLGGHIGYGIKPSERRKGYAQTILRLTLIEANKHGIDKAMLTVNKDNIGSVKAIQSNNGILEIEKEVPGQSGLVQYYWIYT